MYILGRNNFPQISLPTISEVRKLHVDCRRYIYTRRAKESEHYFNEEKREYLWQAVWFEKGSNFEVFL